MDFNSVEQPLDKLLFVDENFFSLESPFPSNSLPSKDKLDDGNTEHKIFKKNIRLPLACSSESTRLFPTRPPLVSSKASIPVQPSYLSETILTKENDAFLKAEFLTPQPPENSFLNPINKRISLEIAGDVSPVFRRFPGPAGLLPPLKTDISLLKEEKMNFSTRKLSKAPFNLNINEIENLFKLSTDFLSGPWMEMIKFFNLEAVWRCFTDNTSHHNRHLLKGTLLEQCLNDLKKRPSQKVSYLVVCFLAAHSGNSSSAEFFDYSASILGTVHRKVFKEYEDLLIQGSVLVLRQVSVFSPSPKHHYLNITLENILCLFRPCTAESVASSQQSLPTCSAAFLLSQAVTPLRMEYINEKFQSEINSIRSLYSSKNSPNILTDPILPLGEPILRTENSPARVVANNKGTNIKNCSLDNENNEKAKKLPQEKKHCWPTREAMRVEDYTTNKGAEANHSVNGWVEENYDFTKKLKNNICDTSKKAEEKAVSIYGANASIDDLLEGLDDNFWDV